jgi:hypothetical protein
MRVTLQLIGIENKTAYTSRFVLRRLCAGGTRCRLYLLRFIDDVRNALDEDPDSAALIQRNVKLLQQRFEPSERKSA